jgi:transcriptional regulator with XRE-family HTH domain
VRGRIAYQIQALREKLGLTQEAFAVLTGKKQSTISRLENTEYGKVSVQTLLDIACSADVALIVGFASYPKFLDETRLMTPEALQPLTIHESLAPMDHGAQGLGSAYERFLQDYSVLQGKSSQSYSANDNTHVGASALYGENPPLKFAGAQ